MGGSGLGSNNRSPIRHSYTGSSNSAARTGLGGGGANGGSSPSDGGASSINDNTVVVASASGFGNMRGRLPTTETTGGRMSGAGSTGNREVFPGGLGFGDSNMGETGPRIPSGSNLENTNMDGIRVSNSGAGSAVISGFTGSSTDGLVTALEVVLAAAMAHFRAPSAR